MRICMQFGHVVEGVGLKEGICDYEGCKGAGSG